MFACGCMSLRIRRCESKCVCLCALTDQALKSECVCLCVHTQDLSHAIMDRALLHADSVYKVPNMRVAGRMCRTNQASNTAFRGFGGPQVCWFLGY